MIATFGDSKFKLYDRVDIKDMSKYLKKFHCKPTGIIVDQKKSWRKVKYMVLLKGCHSEYWYSEDRLCLKKPK